MSLDVPLPNSAMLSVIGGEGEGDESERMMKNRM